MEENEEKMKIKAQVAEEQAFVSEDSTEAWRIFR